MRLRGVPCLIHRWLINDQDDCNPHPSDLKAHTLSPPQQPLNLRGQKGCCPPLYGLQRDMGQAKCQQEGMFAGIQSETTTEVTMKQFKCLHINPAKIRHRVYHPQLQKRKPRFTEVQRLIQVSEEHQVACLFHAPFVASAYLSHKWLFPLLILLPWESEVPPRASISSSG